MTALVPLPPRRPAPPPPPVLTSRYVTLSRLDAVEVAHVLDALIAMDDEGLPVTVTMTVPERAADPVRALRRARGVDERLGGAA